MVRNLITKSVFYGFDLLNARAISSLIRQFRLSDLEGRNPSDVGITSFLNKWGLDPVLERNPVINKLDVKERMAKVDASRIKEFAYTGGSYGEPLRIPISRSRAYYRTATFAYYNALAGYNIGDPFILIRAKNKSPFIKFLRNEYVFIPYDLSDENIDRLLRLIIAKNIRVLVGYPSVIYALALAVMGNESLKRRIGVKSIITVSEPLEESKRQTIKQVFNCHFVDRYSNEEVGLIAQQTAFDSPYMVNRHGIVVEVVDPVSYLPVREGKAGKVVVTDLHNDLIPIARYDTGDWAIADKYQGGRLHSISRITGRSTERIFNSAGNEISPLVLGPAIYRPLADLGRLAQYQFAQTSALQFELRLKSNQDVVNSELISQMKASLLPLLGDGSDLNIVFVEDIKPQPSGKRPIFKNEANLSL